MISSNDFKTGLTIKFEGAIYSIVEFQHVKPGKGAAFVRTKLKNLKTGTIIENSFRAGEKVPKAHIERKKMQYLYFDGNDYVFMDNETYEQLSLSQDVLGENTKFIKENMSIEILFHENEIMGVEVSNFVNLEVVETEPGIKGDTASGGSKPATLETGAVVQVPLFVEQGDIIKVDTRSSEYVERV